MPSEYEKKTNNTVTTPTYQPSQLVQQKQQALTQVEQAKPSDYVSKYGGDMEKLYQQAMNRKPFQYDFNGDAMYQQYAQQYQQAGQQAMMDTMGQAAALTGGYGNSYATTAGNQAYQGYLQQMNNMIPQLAQLAQDRYSQEGEALKEMYGMAQGADQLDYSRYQDMLANWQGERDYANNQYAQEYSRDYQALQDAQSQANWQANYDRSVYESDRDYDRDVLTSDREYNSSIALSLIENGVLPSKELLEAAGIKGEDAQAYIDAYHKDETSTSSSSGGSTTYYNKDTGGGDTGDGNKNKILQTPVSVTFGAWLADKLKNTVK